MSRLRLVMEPTMFQWSRQLILESVSPVLRGLKPFWLLIFRSRRNHLKCDNFMNRPLRPGFSFLVEKSFDFLNDCYLSMADIHIIEWVFSWIIFYWRISHLLSHNSGMAFIACFLPQKSTTIWWLQFSMLSIPLYRPLFLPYLTRWAGTQGSNLKDFKLFV